MAVRSSADNCALLSLLSAFLTTQRKSNVMSSASMLAFHHPFIFRDLSILMFALFLISCYSFRFYFIFPISLLRHHKPERATVFGFICM